ncbi:helix-turn-helix transcriptional regulator [Faecalicatena contorta]|uniref:helix-turn-helix domain-containing protein n=1 Tax=Faecalicatena contorta TaxID=39482 RepID=UPI001F2110B1|nr:helix-turn-helix transcriptional regulator [Faecalicatena contorta]MCF2681052.1 helix-turn-helix transcriptional regulator [Faecalicatena contorta]
MSVFAENLQFYRNRKEMTQEQLAEKMGVSRQTISKWEAGTSYPEMEKLLLLCDLFSCSMDTLMRGVAEELEVEDNQKHRQHMADYRKGVCCGVILLISAVALYEVLVGLGLAEAIADTMFMILVIVAVLILIVKGMEHENYRKKYPIVQDFYPIEEKEEFQKKQPARIAFGVGLILVGMLLGMNAEYFPLLRGMKEDIYYGVFMLMVASAVGIFVHSGMKKEEYNTEKYNRQNHPDPAEKEKDKKIGIWCGCIMLIATILYLIAGFCFELWEISWIVYPIGGMLCGIAALLVKR